MGLQPRTRLLLHGTETGSCEAVLRVPGKAIPDRARPGSGDDDVWSECAFTILGFPIQVPWLSGARRPSLLRDHQSDRLVFEAPVGPDDYGNGFGMLPHRST